MSAQQTLTAAIHFINQEADLLDQGEFHEWLTLWQPQGCTSFLSIGRRPISPTR
jgi:3-phenylpropionate/cinnamic acid dioxygenase small subunit